jgi:vesicle-associated membrane protein 7
MASSSTPAGPLLYACIAYHNTVLTEHTTSSAANTNQLATVILPKIHHDTSQKLTYTHNQNNIHYIADAPPSNSSPDKLCGGGLTYLVVAKSDLNRRIAFGFLVEIKRRFLADYDAERTDFSSLPAYGAAAFNSQLKQLMVDYGTTKAGQNDAISNVQSEIDNVRGIMTENIERVLERGERIDLLVDKTDRLGGSARDFRVRSRGLRRRMWWKNVKLMVLLAVVIVFLVYLLVGFGCGFPGEYFECSTEFQIADHDYSLGQVYKSGREVQRLRGLVYCGVQRYPDHTHLVHVRSPSATDQTTSISLTCSKNLGFTAPPNASIGPNLHSPLFDAFDSNLEMLEPDFLLLTLEITRHLNHIPKSYLTANTSPRPSFTKFTYLGK